MVEHTDTCSALHCKFKTLNEHLMCMVEDNVKEEIVVEGEEWQNQISPVFKVEAKPLHYLQAQGIYYSGRRVKPFASKTCLWVCNSHLAERSTTW